MRGLLKLSSRFAAIVAGLAALPSSAQVARDQLFVSPMGEPFLGGKDAPPDTAWFVGADANQDGKLSTDEMTADAARFFKTLDIDKSGEVDPVELERYEMLIAREIAVRDRGGGRGVFDPERDGNDSLRGAPPAPTRYVGREGAAPFNYFQLPEPVASADINFNRGVSASEFGRVAEERFARLDTNRDGMLSRGELPPLPRGSKRKAKR